jgi:hypothetical protein
LPSRARQSLYGATNLLFSRKLPGASELIDHWTKINSAPRSRGQES